MLHQEREYVAPFAASEAMKDLPVWRNGEGGGFFGMERAEGSEIPAPFLQADVLSDNLDYIGCLTDLVYGFLRNHSLSFTIVTPAPPSFQLPRRNDSTEG